MPRRILPTLVVGVGELGELALAHLRRRLDWTENPDPLRTLFAFFHIEAGPPAAAEGGPSQDGGSEVVFQDHSIRLPADAEKAGATLTDTLRPIISALDDAPTAYRNQVAKLQAAAAPSHAAAFEPSEPVGNAVRAIVLAELARQDDARLARILAESLRAAMPLACTLHAVGVFSLCAESAAMRATFDAASDLGLLPGEGASPAQAGLYDKANVCFTRNPYESLSDVADRAELAAEWCFAMLHLDEGVLRRRGCLSGKPAAFGARSYISSAVPVAERAARQLAI
jgi:hypothetical protein